MKDPISKPGKAKNLQPGPQQGRTGKGRTLDPASTKEKDSAVAGTQSRPAPAPGVPGLVRQYERLKREAEFKSIPRPKNPQEDPSGKM